VGAAADVCREPLVDFALFRGSLKLDIVLVPEASGLPLQARRLREVSLKEANVKPSVLHLVIVESRLAAHAIRRFSKRSRGLARRRHTLSAGAAVAGKCGSSGQAE
jgi:hypothetical protein